MAAPVHDATSNVAAAGTGTLTWTHTPVGTPRGADVAIVQDGGSGDEVAGVTYGGVAMARVRYFASTLGGEDAAVYVYRLGSGIPTGAQTVSMTATGASSKYAACVTVTATADTEEDTHDVLDSAGVANPSITLTATTDVMVYAAIHSGIGALANIDPGADYTEIAGVDFGVATGDFARRTAAASAGPVAADFLGSSDEAGMIAWAIREVAASGPALGSLALGGVGR